jgi:hypothetical protein
MHDLFYTKSYHRGENQAIYADSKYGSFRFMSFKNVFILIIHEKDQRRNRLRVNFFIHFFLNHQNQKL